LLAEDRAVERHRGVGGEDPVLGRARDLARAEDRDRLGARDPRDVHGGRLAGVLALVDVRGAHLEREPEALEHVAAARRCGGK
jgi:hypothetical protein